MIETLIAVLALALSGLFAFLMARDRAAERVSWEAERKQLLDRLMARDFTEYKTLTPDNVSRVPIRQVVTDEDEADEDERRRTA